MSTVNQYNVVGRLGKDPELVYQPDGTPRCTISVATDVGYGDNRDTTWVRATAWGRSAETIEKYFSKGKLIFLTGEIRTFKYEKKGQTHYGWGLDIKSWGFIGGRDEFSDSGSVTSPRRLRCRTPGTRISTTTTFPSDQGRPMWLKTLSGNLLHVDNASSLSKANIIQVLKLVSPETSTIDKWSLDQLRAIGEKNDIQLLHSTEDEARKEFAAKALKRMRRMTGG